MATDTGTKTEFVMPEWMERYRDLIEADLGGNTVENLLNDTKTNGFNNAIRSALICMAESKVILLRRLRHKGLLAPNEEAPRV